MHVLCVSSKTSVKNKGKLHWHNGQSASVLPATLHYAERAPGRRRGSGRAGRAGTPARRAHVRPEGPQQYPRALSTAVSCKSTRLSGPGNLPPAQWPPQAPGGKLSEAPSSPRTTAEVQRPGVPNPPLSFQRSHRCQSCPPCSWSPLHKLKGTKVLHARKMKWLFKESRVDSQPPRPRAWLPTQSPGRWFRGAALRPSEWETGVGPGPCALASPAGSSAAHSGQNHCPGRTAQHLNLLSGTLSQKHLLL